MNNAIENAILHANEAFKEWKKVPFSEKQRLILQAAMLLEDQAEECGAIITSEMGKTITEAVAEVEKCAKMMRFYASVDNVLQPLVIPTEFSKSEVHFDPKGVILGVMPWNFPFWQVLRFVTPTILAGNTVLLKHASICFGSGNAIEKILLEAGFPKFVFQNLEVGHHEVQQILEHHAVQGVSFTGSEVAGAKVASVAAANIKKSVLELGGSDAFIVLNDAKLEEAARVGAKARLQNCGQTCVAAKRFIVQEDIKDTFVEKLKIEFGKYIPNDPKLGTTKFAGMSRKDLADELESQYNFAIANGAEVLLPLERISDKAFYPGLIEVKRGNPILQHEIFGPVGMLMVAENDEEALSLANDIPFGLSNCVWTENEARQNYFIENLESGTVNVNKMSSSDPRFPFGGSKRSGYGVELSEFALKEFVTIKTVLRK